MSEQESVPKYNISSITYFKHLNSDKVDLLDNDLALIDTEGFNVTYTAPCKLEMPTVSLCLRGSATLNINLKKYEVSPGKMVIVLPNQIVESRWKSPDFRTIFISISRNLLSTFPKVGNVLSLFFRLKESPCFDISFSDQEILREYFEFVRKRLRSKEDTFRRETVQGLMQAFSFELYRILTEHVAASAITAKNKTRKDHIFECFYETLVESYQQERSVKYYADRLCLTPKHLSGVIKDVSGLTVGEWIDELVILEAKALLNSTSMNIQEIADRLNFANQSFFGKYFKHYTGMSPKEYRNSISL